MLDEIYIQSLLKKRFNSRSNSFLNGIGDDAAVCNLPSGKIVVSCDSQVENVHFIKNKFKPEEISLRALAIAASDISAMGGNPKFFTNSLFIPKGTSKEFINKIFTGFKKASKKFNILLIGGNVSRSNSFKIDITVIGELNSKKKYKEREKCKKGDYLYVSGNIGDAALGLKILKEKPYYRFTNTQKKLVKKYKQPNPRIELGLFLGKLDYITSMIDITDGLSIDLKRLIGSRNKKKLGAVLFWDDIPKAKEIERLKKRNDSLDCVLHGGDDYELMFTVDKRFSLKFERLAKEKNFKVSRIGEINTSNKIILNIGGQNKVLKPKGFIHKF
tara:strand:+ start:34013 stop:35002 length:990 start_codon:yes stop_codon:yes gene_type:complete